MGCHWLDGLRVTLEKEYLLLVAHHMGFPKAWRDMDDNDPESFSNVNRMEEQPANPWVQFVAGAQPLQVMGKIIPMFHSLDEYIYRRVRIWLPNPDQYVPAVSIGKGTDILEKLPVLPNLAITRQRDFVVQMVPL